MLDPTKYRQMAGRAGRAGIDTEGEAILVASKDNGSVAQLFDLMRVRCSSAAALVCSCAVSAGCAVDGFLQVAVTATEAQTGSAPQ